MQSTLIKTAFFTLFLAIAGCDSSSNPPAGNPVVEFRSAEFFANESDGIATITVLRTGGNTQAASVGYSTNSDTATAGADFESKTGVLVWEEGDSTEKSFDIAILADTDLERRENVILSLGSADGVEIGVLNKASLTILDSECSGELTENIIAEQTLTQGCYLVINDVFVERGGKLIVHSGVTLIFEAGSKLQIDEGGSLVAVGTVDQNIIFTGAQQEPGFWNGIVIFGSDSTDNQIGHVKIEYAGFGTNGAALSVLGNTTAEARVRINDTIFSNGDGYGFIFADNANIDNFSGITSTGNGLGAGRIPMRLIPILNPSSSTFSGNKRDFLELAAGTLEDDQLWPILNVPYALASGGHIIRSNITITDGTIVAFDANASLIIEDTGVLIAVGTAENHVRFTGLEPTPGSWAGIEFAGSSTNTASQMSFCTIENGGGGGFLGNIVLSGRSGLSLVNITNSNILNSLEFGIWVNPTDAFVQESGNFFEGNQSGDINS